MESESWSSSDSYAENTKRNVQAAEDQVKMEVSHKGETTKAAKESNLRQMDTDIEEAETIQGQHLSEDDSTSIIWTNTFMQTLQSIVESHALVESGADEVGDTHRSTMKNITVEIGHLDLDSISDSDNMQEYKDGEEELDDTHFRRLHEFLKNEEISNTIDVPVKVNAGELLLVLIKYELVCSLSFSAVSSLFIPINCIFARPILPQFRFLIDKLFNPSNSVKFHALCTECGFSLGILERSDSKKHCLLCNVDINVKHYFYKDFFVTLDPSTHIKHFLETNSDYYHRIMNYSRSEDNVLRDIYDGKLYRQFVNSLDPAVKKSYISVTFNTDGAPLLESFLFDLAYLPYD
ncbi:uncharacterized protein LOC117177754 [Belonocnema kinseyi]|uniref:uncharacterized protein LOC117177754 n=1 Tax=Belonocnema kinseyi TaxID=2817044 RepID=UPI00143CD13B|nr:uncharacterized protein LOC117177754 [Belonocnema kinseyi]